VTPMTEAWLLLKRQTTLGEFHPNLPSPYGPVTMRRAHPTQAWFDKIKEFPDFDSDLAQPYEQIFTHGLKAQPLSLVSALWEQANKYEEPYIKRFNLNIANKGNWFYPTGPVPSFVYDASSAYPNINVNNRQYVGVRMSPAEVKGKFRNLGYQGEGPEAFVQQDISPERLVRLPENWTGEGTGTWGRLGQ
jgi:hypothetical protein